MLQMKKKNIKFCDHCLSPCSIFAANPRAHWYSESVPFVSRATTRGHARQHSGPRTHCAHVWGQHGGPQLHGPCSWLLPILLCACATCFQPARLWKIQGVCHTAENSLLDFAGNNNDDDNYFYRAPLIWTRVHSEVPWTKKLRLFFNTIRNNLWLKENF